MRGREPAGRQGSELRRFLDSQTFSVEYPKAYAKCAEADALLWPADSEQSTNGCLTVLRGRFHHPHRGRVKDDR